MPQCWHQTDFASKSEPEPEQWIEGVITDLGGDNPKATGMAIKRLQTILDSLDQSSGMAMQIYWSYIAMATDASIPSPSQLALHHIAKLTGNVLFKLFSYPRLALAVLQSIMSTLLEEQIRRIVGFALKPDKHGVCHFCDREQLFKGLHALIIRILDKADRTRAFYH
ncbi:hypothetical protein DL89DRAFT_253944 [Linderina pennispora]|uniref:Uncharacterized protein n=1 Tax=Linderina pennispora TaxID=61395 RepID=A0A1Y1WKH8_9FUNG|nr:uncharacterized protein DL89DRAFT_253944 [Linderina pennispora]ORX74047.1 hypothetical protein DL89DRAFT_253944 [Linderina pennispora]